MAQIVYQIADNIVALKIAQFCAAVPNTEKNEDGTPKYTDAQWVKESGRRYFLTQISNGEKKLYSNQYNQTTTEGDVT